MGESICYLNGQYVKWSEAKVSIHDRGFMWGDSVYEHSRTFNRKPHLLDKHIDRLFRSFNYISLDMGLTKEEVNKISLEVLKRNEENLSPDGIIIHRVSRGIQWEAIETPRTVVIDCLPVERYVANIAKGYIEGVHIITSTFRRSSPQCLDPKVKHDNRLNQMMADIQVKALDPKAYSLTLDMYGFLAEGYAQNIFVVKEGKLLTPRRDNILEGITREVILNRVAKELDIDCAETNLSLYDAYSADEMFLTATSFTILPVARIDGRAIGRSIPGPITKRLTEAWSNMVGVDIVKQGLDYARQAGVH